MTARSPILGIATWSMLGAFALIAQACESDDNSQDDGSTATTNDQSSSQTETSHPAATYWQDVAPIYARSCVGCHQPGAIGPFDLTTYASAKNYAAASVAAVVSRQMPPWLLTNDESCGIFEHSPALSDAEIETISNWASHGMPEGTPAEIVLPPIATLAQGTDYFSPNFVPQPQGTALAPNDEYRCFLVDSQTTSDLEFINAFDVEPGNPEILHHVLAILVDPTATTSNGKTNGEIMQALDDESPDRDGWPCYGLAGDEVDDSGLLAAWAPGMGAVEYNHGVGIPIAKTDKIVLQIHYNFDKPNTIGTSDSTRIRLRHATTAQRVGVMALPDGLLDTLGDDPYVIPPGEAAHTYAWEMSWEDTFGESGLPFVDVVGVFPHMHEAGKSLKMELTSAGQNECLANLPEWDFHWQLMYFRQTPMRFEAGKTFRTTCTFDTRDRTEPTYPGWGTGNEMCLGGLLLALPEQSPRHDITTLRASLRNATRQLLR